MQEFIFGVPPMQYSQEYISKLVGDLENWSRQFAGRTSTYTTNNYSESRTIDASTATLDEVRQFVATLAADLKKLGFIK